MFVSLSLLEAGYTVFANADASGTFDVRTADNANARMREAGVYVMPQFAVAADLQRDWRNPPGIPVFLDLLFKYVYFREGPDVSGSLLIQPRITLGSSPPSTTLSGCTVVQSSTVLSSPARISSFKTHFKLHSPFRADFGHTSRLGCNEHSVSYYELKYELIHRVPFKKFGLFFFANRMG